jgi:Domain of unknown function (DUF5666)
VDGFLRALFALIAALNAATGAPIDANNMPDRPPIVAPTMERIPHKLPVATSVATKPMVATTTITGTIASMKDGMIVVDGQSITLSSSTQITGSVKTGSPVRVQVKIQSDGTMEAETLEVGHAIGAAVATITPTVLSAANPVTTTTQTPAPGETQAGPISTETPEPDSTEQAQASPTTNPSAQPTGQSTTNPTEQPETQPTSKPSDGTTTTTGSTPTSGGTAGTPSPEGGTGD